MKFKFALKEVLKQVVQDNKSMCCAVFKIDNLPPPCLLGVLACFLAEVSLRKTKGIQRIYQNLCGEQKHL